MGLDQLLDRLQWFPIVVWSVVPPLLLLLFHHRRLRSVPPLNGALLLFAGGMLAGELADGIEWIGRWLVQTLPPSLALSAVVPEQALFAQVLWQTLMVAPAAEACKFAAVGLPLGWVIRRYQQLPAQPSTVLLATIAVACGFAAQTNLVTLWYHREPVINVLFALPMQAIFSMAWGFALGVALCRMGRHPEYAAKLMMHSWLAACLCHGAWNGLLVLSRLPGHLATIGQPPVHVTPAHLLYCLYPWALWLWWQTERMRQRSQGEVVPLLITATTPRGRLGQMGICLLCLGFGGAALYALRDFGDSLQDTWEMRLTFDRPTAIALVQEFLRTIILGTIGLYLFDRLRQADPNRQTS
jgi:RsiW-degrading membrane proteinase PrsW (M82 family)